MPSAAWHDSMSLVAASVGASSSGLYIGRSSSRMLRSSVSAPALAAPSRARIKAARLLDTFAIEPPRPTMVSLFVIVSPIVVSRHVVRARTCEHFPPVRRFSFAASGRSADRCPDRARGEGEAMRPIHQQTILVTGATDGLGKALAHELARLGATVLLHGRSKDRLEAAVEETRKATRSDRPRSYL